MKPRRFDACVVGDSLTQLDTLHELDTAILSRVIGYWLREHLKLPSIGFLEIDSVRWLLTPGDISKVNLPGGCFARRKAGKLWVQMPSTAE
jgi:hypothetical protein